MAFSEGAGLAAMLMIHKVQCSPMEQHLHPVFKCAIFFSGGVPADPGTLEQREEVRFLDYERDGELIGVPTAHIWGKNDMEYPAFGPVLSRLCKADLRKVFIHEGGHEVPGRKDPPAMGTVVQIIRHTIAVALNSQ